MNNKRYQYHIFNNNVNFMIVSILKDEEYVINLAKRVAIDYYNFEEPQLQDIKANLVVEFYKESVVNLDMLPKVVSKVGADNGKTARQALEGDE